VLELRRTIRDVLTPHENGICEGDDFEILVDDIKEQLPSTIIREVIRDSVIDLAGERLRPELLTETAWRLAGNVKRMSKHRKAVTPWNRQSVPEWVPVQVLEVRRRMGPKGRAGWMFTFQVLAGLSCPEKLTAFWTPRFCAFISKRLGFRKRRPSGNETRPVTGLYSHPIELVTMRLLVLIDPDLSAKEPKFEKTHMSPALLDWNKEQLKYRDRILPKCKCPKSYPTSKPCYRCHVGYSNCRAGTHRLDYAFAYCEHCGTDKAPFDDDISRDRCLACYEQQIMKRGA